jgi:mRNA interferase RelE/StbE
MRSAVRELADLRPADQRRIAAAIDGLTTDPRPHGSRLLSGQRAARIWRLHVGDYRVLYEIRDDQLLVLIIRIGHRRDIYRTR